MSVFRHIFLAVTIALVIEMRNTMSTLATHRATRLTAIAPQFLVDDLDRAIAYYRDQLGFELEFKYQSFYAAVTRDGIAIHLKCAPKSLADREHRKQNEHLDAYIAVQGIRPLFSELNQRGAQVFKPLEERPWACLDFYVEDPDGYILCFSEQKTDSE
jgi:catechol 2,3-dioxygenase-like lactoylglutathione lyase family enzyme